VIFFDHGERFQEHGWICTGELYDEEPGWCWRETAGGEAASGKR